MPSIRVEERELPLIQRGIIDNCFEEGQYEYGIDVLDKLRGQGYKPPPFHIRQLLYISLYPPPSPSKTSRGMDRIDVPPSPQKIQLQRQKDDLWPKPTSRPLAIALLEAFVGTNTPECLMRGLPSHYTNSEGRKDFDPFRDSSEDNSPLKGELFAIQLLKDCWGLLKDGFVKRKQVDRSRMADLTSNREPNQPQDSVVGPYAWPVLEWFIRVFEKDEREERENGDAPYSVLLLNQIPQPKTKRAPREDAERPVQVALACFYPLSHTLDHPDKYASSKARCDLGMRLISLLVNLTLTQPPLLSPSYLLRILKPRLIDLPLSSLQAFLSVIPTSQTQFKISVLDGYISSGNVTEDESTQKAGTSVPRAKPRFAGRGASDEASSETATSTGVRDKYKDPYPVPPRNSVLALLSSPLTFASTPDSLESSPSPFPFSATKLALAKFHLVSALCNLQFSSELADPQWRAAVREGILRQTVLNGFTLVKQAQMGHGMVVDDEREQESDEQKIKDYMTSALEMVRVWEVSITERS